MLFRQLIKQKLEVEGVPLDVLARETRLPNSSLSYYVKGRQPTRKSLEKLSVYFNLPISQLLEEDDQDILEKLDEIRPLSAKGKTAEEKRLLEDFRRADRIDRLMILRMAELAAGGSRK